MGFCVKHTDAVKAKLLAELFAAFNRFLGIFLGWYNNVVCAVKTDSSLCLTPLRSRPAIG